MGKASINKMTGANVYVGGNSLLGKTSEITLPEITSKVIEHASTGMLGTAELFAGVEAMEMTIKWSSFYSDTFREVADPTKAVTMQIRGNLETFEGGGKSTEVAYVVNVVGTPKKFPTGSFTQHENAEFESSFSINSIKIESGGTAIMEFDVFANIYKVNGIDIMQTYRNNLGA